MLSATCSDPLQLGRGRHCRFHPSAPANYFAFSSERLLDFSHISPRRIDGGKACMANSMCTSRVGWGSTRQATLCIPPSSSHGQDIHEGAVPSSQVSGSRRHVPQGGLELPVRPNTQEWRIGPCDELRECSMFDDVECVYKRRLGRMPPCAGADKLWGRCEGNPTS